MVLKRSAHCLCAHKPGFDNKQKGFFFVLCFLYLSCVPQKIVSVQDASQKFQNAKKGVLGGFYPILRGFTTFPGGFGVIWAKKSWFLDLFENI